MSVTCWGPTWHTCHSFCQGHNIVGPTAKSIYKSQWFDPMEHLISWMSRSKNKHLQIMCEIYFIKLSWSFQAASPQEFQYVSICFNAGLFLYAIPSVSLRSSFVWIPSLNSAKAIGCQIPESFREARRVQDLIGWFQWCIIYIYIYKYFIVFCGVSD